jgi:hypothetical protein
MLSRLSMGAVISIGVSDMRCAAICTSEAFVQDLCAIGFGLAGSLFSAGVLQNCCGSSKSLLTAAKLARRGG